MESLLSKRAYNFNAGPALPLEVLERAQAEFVNYGDTGMSIMEMSHRGAVYEAVHNEAQERLLSLLGNPSGYKVLFIQGGASTQFAMIPMNFLGQGQVANYVMTGSWSDKAIKEAKLIGETHVAASSEESKYMALPSLKDILLSDRALISILRPMKRLKARSSRNSRIPARCRLSVICRAIFSAVRSI